MAPLVFFSDPDDVAAVLAAPPSLLSPAAGTKLIAPLIGERSFFVEDGKERDHVRSAVAAGLRRLRREPHPDEIAAIVREETASWPSGEAVALYPRLGRLTLRIILNALFGRRPETVELEQRLPAMLAVARSSVIQIPRLRALPVWHDTWTRFWRERHEVDRLIRTIIAQAPAEHPSVLGALVQASSEECGFPLDDLADQLLSLIVAGHETTASALAWAFLLLAHNPSVQARLIEEIDSAIGEEYLMATVLETLRRGPVFLFAIPRVVVAPTQIHGAAYRPPAQLLACTYLMHNDPSLFPSPTEFRPERFIQQPPPPRIWQPWGGGRRRCLGQQLAMFEMKTVLREILSTQQVRPAAQAVERAHWRSAILAPAAGARVLLEPRSTPFQ